MASIKAWLCLLNPSHFLAFQVSSLMAEVLARVMFIATTLARTKVPVTFKNHAVGYSSALFQCLVVGALKQAKDF